MLQTENSFVYCLPDQQKCCRINFSNLHSIILHPSIMKCLAFLKGTYVVVFYIKLFKSKKASHYHCSMLYRMQFTHSYKSYLDRLAFYIIRRDLYGGGQFLMATEHCRFFNRTMSNSELHVSKKYKTGLMENPDQF